MLKFFVSSYAACFLRKVCDPLWSTWGTPLGEGKSGVKAGIINPKVARRARAGQPPPPRPSVHPGNEGEGGTAIPWFYSQGKVQL